MADNYVALANGRLVTKSATATTGGVADAGKIVALDAAGLLDAAMLPAGVGADVQNLPASEALAAGSLVNVWNDTGTARARKADASTAGKEASGFVLSAVASGQTAAVHSEGSVSGLSGLTPGARYYLSAATPGAVAAAPPAASGNVVQFVGTAHSASVLSFEPSDGVVLE